MIAGTNKGCEKARDESRDLLEILDDRYRVKATLIASQVPRDRWAEWFPDAIVAEAILDRVVHQAYHIAMHGESMRKVLPSRSPSGITESMTTS